MKKIVFVIVILVAVFSVLIFNSLKQNEIEIKISYVDDIMEGQNVEYEKYLNIEDIHVGQEYIYYNGSTVEVAEVVALSYGDLNCKDGKINSNNEKFNNLECHGKMPETDNYIYFYNSVDNSVFPMIESNLIGSPKFN
jgi:hypothetical protein